MYPLKSFAVFLRLSLLSLLTGITITVLTGISENNQRFYFGDLPEYIGTVECRQMAGLWLVDFCPRFGEPLIRENRSQPGNGSVLGGYYTH